MMSILNLLADWPRHIVMVTTFLSLSAMALPEALAGQVTAVGSSGEPPGVGDQKVPMARNAQEREQWQNAVGQAPAARKGCFESKISKPRVEGSAVRQGPGHSHASPPRTSATCCRQRR